MHGSRPSRLDAGNPATTPHATACIARAARGFACAVAPGNAWRWLAIKLRRVAAVVRGAMALSLLGIATALLACLFIIVGSGTSSLALALLRDLGNLVGVGHP